jgi:hypothetical protein
MFFSQLIAQASPSQPLPFPEIPNPIIEPTPPPASYFWWSILFFSLVLILFYYIYKQYQKHHKKKQHQQIIEAYSLTQKCLIALLDQNLTTVTPKQSHLLSTTLRQYFQLKYNFPALCLTHPEIFKQQRLNSKSPPLIPSTQLAINRFSELSSLCDFISFSNLTSSPASFNQSIKRALQLLEEDQS